MYPPATSRSSSQWAARIRPSLRQVSIRERIMLSLWTPFPSSEKAITRPAIPARSAASIPFSPMVRAP